MPTDVAMHEPDTRVVGEEGEDEVTTLASWAITGHEGDITTGRVDQVELDGGVIGSVTSGKNVEIVTVKMDGVAKWNSGLDNDVDPFAKVGDFDGEVARVVGNGVIVVDVV